MKSPEIWGAFAEIVCVVLIVGVIGICAGTGPGVLISGVLAICVVCWVCQNLDKHS